MDTKAEDKLTGAREQGQAQFDSIKALVLALRAARDSEDDRSELLEQCETTIQENTLSIQVRSGWVAPGQFDSDSRDRAKAEEYEILLCTGGPACRIVGTLSEHLEPDTAHLEVQDWFTPWVEIRPRVVSIGVEAQNDAEVTAHYDSEPILLEYARQFWFGE